MSDRLPERCWLCGDWYNEAHCPRCLKTGGDDARPRDHWCLAPDFQPDAGDVCLGCKGSDE
jgi:hypothetical protein